MSDWQVFRIEDHEWLVGFHARRYKKAVDTGRIGYDDLHQVGCMGLLHACSKFDPSRGFMFSTYASRWVQNAMQRLIDYGSFPVYYPNNHEWRPPKDAPPRQGGVSLDQCKRSADGDDSDPLKNFLRSRDPSQEQTLFDTEIRCEAHLMVAAALPVIGQRAAQIMVRIATGELLVTVAKDHGISRARVHQIYLASLARCRKLPQAKRAKQLLESA